MAKKKKTKDNTISIKLPDILRFDGSKLLLPLIVILILVLIVSTLTVFKTNLIIKEKVAEAEEAQRPAEIELTQILARDCEDCFDVQSIINQLNTSSFKINNIRAIYYDSSEGRQLIARYNIEKIPSLIITGEIDKSNVKSKLSSLGKREDNAIIFDKQQPPYIDANTGKIIGMVSVTLITDPSCDNCFDVGSFNQQLDSLGVKFGDKRVISYTEPEAVDLINKHNITRIPTAIYSGDIIEYTSLFQTLQQILESKGDNFILTQVSPPYRDLNEDRIVGLVDVTYLVDDSCSQCYDVSLHKQILEGGYGVFISSEKRVDVNSTEGEDLLNQYSITKIPTVILSPDAKYYLGLVNTWTNPQGGVGTIEDNGYFVFRNIDVMGVPYRDLTTGNVVGA